MAETIFAPRKGDLAAQLAGVKGFFRILTAERKQQAHRAQLDEDFKKAEKQRLRQLKNKFKRRKAEVR